MSGEGHHYLRVVLSISRMQGDRLQVQTAIQINRGDKISLPCHVSLRSCTTEI